MQIKNLTDRVERFDFGNEEKTMLPGHTYKFEEINSYIEGKIAIGDFAIIEKDEKPKTTTT